MTVFTAGTASAVITPPVGTPLDGYTAREEGAKGVHDDLYARALVLDDGTAQVALVSCDLLAVDWRLVAQARERASAATGIPGEHILIGATHTHSGPALMGNIDPALAEATARQIAGAIAVAHGSKREVVLKAGSTEVESIGQNRRHPDGPVDTVLHVLLFDHPDPLQPPVAGALNFSCHATVLNASNLLVSADYFGHAARTVEAVFPGLQPLTFNGACGDVNPMWIEQEHAEAGRAGKIVGAAAARLIAELRPLAKGQRAHNIRWDEFPEKPVARGELVQGIRLRAARHQIELPVRRFLPPEEYEATVRELEARAGSLREGPVDERRSVMGQLTRLRTERQVARGLAGRERPLRAEVQAVSLAPGLALLALPGEFFVETVEDIRGRAGIARLPVACYANHYVGYVVPPHAYEEGGYEAGITFLAPEAEGIVKDTALAVLAEVGR